MWAPFRALLLMTALAPSAWGATASTAQLPTCGDDYFMGAYGEPPARVCGPASERLYRPKYGGLAYDILAIESEACFVPDEAYRLLDTLMDDIHSEIDALGYSRGEEPTAGILDQIGQITVDTLVRHRFRLYIGTDTIGDALTLRVSGSTTYYPFDCDIGALVLMTVSQHYEIPVSLVQTRLSKEATHNYVRWRLADGTILDWDTNGRGPCETRGEHPPWQGRAWTDEETLSYILRIRADAWRKQGQLERALSDFERAMELGAAHPVPFNGYAWLVATRQVANRDAHAVRAQTASEHAVGLERSGNYLDTLACVYALRGQFTDAASIEREAVSLIDDPETIARFNDRIRRFTAASPSDCTGDD